MRSPSQPKVGALVELGSRSNNPDLELPRLPGAKPEFAPGFTGALRDGSLDLVAEARELGDALEVGLESILGTDDRRIELRTTAAPWRAICSLEIQSARGPYRGTGWLAGPRSVVTSGHCVFSPDRFGGWAQSIVVSPGRSWRGQPFGAFQAASFSCSEPWRASQDKAFDVGCIHLKEPVGQDVGWLAFATPTQSSLADALAVVSGYPEYAGAYDNLLTSRGPVRAIRGNRVFYEIDTTDGQSGSPIWLAGDGLSNPTVVGVHAYEKDSTPADLGIEANSGVLITPEILGLILQWRGQAQ